MRAVVFWSLFLKKSFVTCAALKTNQELLDWLLVTAICFFP